jgi:hypothetical protein
MSHHVSSPRAHQQNGSTECKHRRVVELELTIVATASIPLQFWDKAFLIATHLINMLPTRVINFEAH